MSSAVLEVLLAWAGRVGLVLLSLVFLANALGVVDQERPVRELAAGLPRWLAPNPRAMVAAGRVLQLVAAPALFVPAARPFAAVALAGFLVPATLAAHAFWRAPPAERGAQLVNFLKNASLIGGLLVAAGWQSGG